MMMVINGGIMQLKEMLIENLCMHRNVISILSRIIMNSQHEIEGNLTPHFSAYKCCFFDVHDEEGESKVKMRNSIKMDWIRYSVGRMENTLKGRYVTQFNDTLLLMKRWEKSINPKNEEEKNSFVQNLCKPAHSILWFFGCWEKRF